MIVAQFSIWLGGLNMLNIDTQLNSKKIKWIQRLLNPTNVLWKDLILYRLNLILNYNQGLALFRQKQILRSNRHKNASPHFTNNNFSTLMSTEKFLTNPY